MTRDQARGLDIGEQVGRQWVEEALHKSAALRVCSSEISAFQQRAGTIGGLHECLLSKFRMEPAICAEPRPLHVQSDCDS